MRIIVAVVVYDRLSNVREWVRCWKQCEKKDAELFIIHNYRNEEDKHSLRTFCEESGVRHIPRENVGMDIGALQDVCRGRLEGFPNQWDYLFWSTDDFIPMAKNFLSTFLEVLKQPKVGVACLEISREVKEHVRTAGFMITQLTASKLTFPVERVVTKTHCYEFEHRGQNAFLEQIKKMGKRAMQVHPDFRKGPLWDVHIRGHLNRWEQHNKEFPIEDPIWKSNKVTIICPIYERFPQAMGTFINQTHQNWQLLLIHDGPNTTKLRQLVDEVNDRRIKYIEMPTRQGSWGHPIRKWALENMDTLSPNTDYVYITNDDNTAVPHFLEYMIKGFDEPHIIATYPSKFVHAYLSPQPDGDHKYGTIDTRPALGFMDCCCVLLKKEVACSMGWNDMEHAADWTFFEAIIQKYGKKAFKRVLGTLVTHN